MENVIENVHLVSFEICSWLLVSDNRGKWSDLYNTTRYPGGRNKVENQVETKDRRNEKGKRQNCE